jgi:hypothetical protein
MAAFLLQIQMAGTLPCGLAIGWVALPKEGAKADGL